MNSTARLPTALKNCVLSGNGPADASLVINGNSAALAKATISRCIFVNNSSSTTGAVSAIGGSHIMMDNCVFYNNSKPVAAMAQVVLIFWAQPVLSIIAILLKMAPTMLPPTVPVSQSTTEPTAY